MKNTTWEEFDAFITTLKSDPMLGEHPPMVVYRAVDLNTFAPKFIFFSENGKQTAEQAIDKPIVLEWVDR